jgi:single-strand DNA-binding protein
MLNKVMIIGRLGRDPELRYTQTGTAIANLRIATDESYTDRDGNKVERVEWHTAVVYQRAAENCANYLGKGSLVFVEGSLYTEKWQDDKGQDRYTTKIRARLVKFLDRRNDANAPAPAGEQRPAQQGGNQRRDQAPQDDPYGGMDDLGPAFPSEHSGMDDVPF